MKLRVLSDLHMEHTPFSLIWCGEDALALVGDVSHSFETTYNLIQVYLNSNQDTRVLFVLGNHDYYGDTVDNTTRRWRGVCMNRFHFLENDSVVFGGVRFCGCTMWTDIDGGDLESVELCRNILRDFKTGYIKDFTTSEFMRLHSESRNWLEKEVNESIEPVIVMTHYLPIFKSIHADHLQNPVNPSFVSTDLEGIVKRDNVLMWIHGHTHGCLDYMEGDVRVLCNPRGKPGENHAFEANMIVDIATAPKIDF